MHAQDEVFGEGDSAEAVERFIPSGERGIEYIKLAHGKGWIPMTNTNGIEVCVNGQ